LAGPQSKKAEAATIINQDACLYLAELPYGQTILRALAFGRHAWLQVVRGQVSLNGQAVDEGDGAAISAEMELSVTGKGAQDGEILLFDLP
jgi:redox-sensitive bicupin YhaK (pirin superfamily)